jgi:hypothetical protein
MQGSSNLNLPAMNSGERLRSWLIQCDESLNSRKDLHRRCLVLVLVFSLVLLSVQSFGIHTHSASGLRHGCVACKAALAGHGVISGGPCLLELKMLVTSERVGIAVPAVAKDFLQDSSPGRAPPRS